MQIYIGQRHALRLFGIFKAYIVEINGTVLHLGQPVFRARQRTFFFSVKTSTIRSADSIDIVIITNTIDSIIRLMRI